MDRSLLDIVGFTVQIRVWSNSVGYHRWGIIKEWDSQSHFSHGARNFPPPGKLPTVWVLFPHPGWVPHRFEIHICFFWRTTMFFSENKVWYFEWFFLVSGIFFLENRCVYCEWYVFWRMGMFFGEWVCFLVNGFVFREWVTLGVLFFCRWVCCGKCVCFFFQRWVCFFF